MIHLFRFFFSFLLFPLAAFSHTLTQQTEAEVARILMDEIPGFHIDSIQLVSEGWDNLVADVNHEWIFRFPRSESFLVIYDREQKLLNRLHGKVTMPIPYYEYLGSQTAFVGYRKIQGIGFKKDEFLAIPEDKKHTIAQSLALFITQMHGALTVDEALGWGYSTYHVPTNWIESSIFGTLSPDVETMIKEALEEYAANPPTNFVLIHNDLHGGNMAYDPLTNRITGIFDFSDAVVADYTVEFSKFFEIHADLAVLVGNCYAEMNDVEPPTNKAAVDYILRRATYILYARENGNAKHERNLIRMLNEFLPIWDQHFRNSPKI